MASPNPFSNRVVDIELPAGGSVLDIMNAAGCDRALYGGARVYIVDREMTKEPVEIEPHNWLRVYPKPGMFVSIRVTATPGKSGGGGKNPLRTILTIAVIAAAWYVGPLVAGKLGFEAGTLAFKVAAGAIGAVTSLVGNAIVNAIAPIPTPKISQATGLDSLTAPTLTITGSQNRIVPGAPVTQVVGESRLYPLMRTDAPPYTEAQGSNQYLRQLFDLGYGPLELPEERIGTVPLDQYEEVESDFAPGDDTAATPGLYTNTIRQDPYSIVLSAGVPRSVVSRINADEITGDLSFQGLTEFDNNGNPGSRTVQVKVEYRKAGSGDPLTLAGTETVTAATTSLYTHPFRFVTPERSDYEVVFTRLTADSGSTRIRDECVVSALRTVTYTPPAIPRNRSVKTMRARATNQLNGVIESYNCIARRLYPIWDGATWSEPQATRNPAWAALAKLRLPRRGNAKPMADSRIHLESWLAFAQWCDRPDQNGEPMFQVGGVIDTRGTVKDTVDTILGTARAWLDKIDGKWAVGWDQPQDAAVQMFTERDSWDFEWERTFVDLPHALVGKFINPALDYQQDKVILYLDGHDETTASEFEAIEYFLVDRSSQVWRDLVYREAEARSRPAKYWLKTDMQYLQCRRGSKVMVSNRIMRWGLGDGRIKSLTTDPDGNVLAVTLDTALVLESGKSYGIRFRRSDSSQIRADLAPVTETVETKTFTLATAIAAASAPAKGDTAAFGLAGGRETVALIVRSIQRLGGMDARLELVDEAPGVHTADQGTLPTFDPQQTYAGKLAIQEPPRPIIRDIVSDERAMVPSPAGGWIQGIDILLQPQSGIAVDVGSILARYRRVGSNDVWAQATAGPFADKVRLAPVEEGVAYEFTLLATSSKRPGVVSAPTYVANHTVIGRSTPPPKPTTVTLNNGVLDAPGYEAPIDFDGFKVSYKLGDDRVVGGAASAHPAVPTVTLPFDVSRLPDGMVTLFVVGVDTSGNESDPAIIVKDITGPVIANVVETTDWRTLEWAGTVTGGSADAGDLVADNLAPFVPESDTAPFVPATDTAAFVPDDAAGNFAEMIYVASFAATAAMLPARATLSRDIAGQAAIDYRTDTDEVFVPADDDLPFVPASDDEPFVPALGNWRSWPGTLDLAAQGYEIRVTIAGGATQGKIRELAVIADVEDVDETFLNFVVAPGGTRLPLAKTYRQGIIDVGLTLLGDGGDAVGARAVIDGVAPGPIIECTDTAGNLVSGHVNARPKGY